VGRAAGCHVALPEDTFASQLHARLFRRDGRMWLEDLGSTNGTYLNAKAVAAPVALRRGDRVQVGRTVLEVTK
ncbi:MAG: FHA domain-containing protein, partial [Acidimicrobiales bacterium]